MSSNKIIFAVVGLVIVIGFGIGGYFLFGAMGNQHEQNVSSLENFGSMVSAISDHGESIDNSDVQLPSIGESKLSATDKIIISLSSEKNKLIQELAAAKEQIADLESQVALLNNYKDTNERYSPRLMEEERKLALKRMMEYLDGTPEAEQFTTFQREVMIQQSANIYLDVVRRFHLNITDQDRNKLLNEYLPGYAFCIGNDIGLVANSRQERSKVLQYFKTLDKSLLTPSALEDIDIINTPCLARLNEQVLPYFRADLK